MDCDAAKVAAAGPLYLARVDSGADLKAELGQGVADRERASYRPGRSIEQC